MDHKLFSSKASSLDSEEIKKFANIAQEWWDPLGKLAPLHAINPHRIKYIMKQLRLNFANQELNQIELIDIGCGGGLLAEPLARLGFKISAIDAAKENIIIAKEHASSGGLAINYRNYLVEDIQNEQYDIVVAFEILEHVSDINYFIQNCYDIVKKQGLLIFSTMNKTIKSYLESIFIAENILKWVPKGTHDWHKFVPPSQIVKALSEKQMQLVDISGLKYSIMRKDWFFTNNIDNNYFITVKKL